jgi:opine dehydrogenase
LNTRFIYEDIPNGLCLLSSLAKKAEIDTPICDSLILLANALMKTDYWKAARTKERLGFANWTVTDIINYSNKLEIPKKCTELSKEE